MHPKAPGAVKRARVDAQAAHGTVAMAQAGLVATQKRLGEAHVAVAVKGAALATADVEGQRATRVIAGCHAPVAPVAADVTIFAYRARYPVFIFGSGGDQESIR